MEARRQARPPRASIAAIASIALIADLVSACSSSPVASTAPSAAPTNLATPLITPTPPPAVTQRFVFDKDRVVDTKLAGTDDLYINPGAVIEKDGVLHMFPNSFSAWPGRMLIPHLTSTDGGATWVLDRKTQPVDSTGFELANPGIDVSTGFVTDDGTWVLIYESVSTSVPWKLARMTAPSPEGPWTVEHTPILQAGASGSFDQGGIE